MTGLKKRKDLVLGIGVLDTDEIIPTEKGKVTCPYYKLWRTTLGNAKRDGYYSYCENVRSFVFFRAWLQAGDYDPKKHALKNFASAARVLDMDYMGLVRKEDVRTFSCPSKKRLPMWVVTNDDETLFGYKVKCDTNKTGTRVVRTETPLEAHLGGLRVKRETLEELRGKYTGRTRKLIQRLVMAFDDMIAKGERCESIDIAKRFIELV